MSRIDELISEQCSNGVPYASLGDCLIRTKGTKITADQMQQLHKENAPVKIFAGGKTVAYFDYNDLPEKDIQTNPSIIVKSRGLVEFEYYDGPFSHKNEFWAYHSKNNSINIKYVYYYLKNQESYFRSIATSMGSLPQIAIPITDNFRIPIPPIAIQEEIVRILDNFTELSARNIQYNYYRNNLLTFGSDIQYYSLDILCSKITDGSHTSPKAVENGYKMPSVKDMQSNGFDFSTCKQISENDYFNLVANGCRPEKNDILIAKDGSMLKYAFVQSESMDIVLLSSIAILRPKLDIVNPYYLAHYFRQQSFRETVIREHSSKGGVPRIILKNFKKIQVPIPSLEEQGRIVASLDRFESLCNDLTIGLPAEINARRMQYEYYRDRLLTFKELEG